MTNRIVTRLIRWRWLFFVCAILLAVPAHFVSSRLDFDHSIENMFAKNDELLIPYRRLKKMFGGNEVVLAVYTDSDLLTPAGFLRIQKLTRQLESVSGVESTVSISTTPLGSAIVTNSPAAKKMLSVMEGYAVGPARDGKYDTVSIVCLLDPDQQAESRGEAIRTIRWHVQEHDIPGVIAGEPVMVVDGFRFLSLDGITLGYTSLVLLSLTILICFRSLRWLLIPLAVIQLTLILTQATLVLSRLQLSMVSSMLTAIVTVIAVATVIHVIVRFREARAAGGSKLKAIVQAGRMLTIPIVLACLTDAVGFAALFRSRVGPVQDFGVMMAIGALMVIVSVAVLVPALALVGRFDVDPRRAWGERSLDTSLARLVDLLLKRPKLLGSISAIVALVVALGAMRLNVETNFTRNFRSDSEIVKSYEVVESQLGGAGVLDLLVESPQPLDIKFLDRIRKLQSRLRTEVTVRQEDGPSALGLTKVFSLIDMLDAGESFPVVNAIWRVLPVTRKVETLRGLLPKMVPTLYN
ncbi:MAG: MMPL family transporter, partial [Planctomycetales bacterium]